MPSAHHSKPAWTAAGAPPWTRLGIAFLLRALVAVSVALPAITGACLRAQAAPTAPAAKDGADAGKPAPPAATAPATPAPPDDDIVELNPFVVNAREDRGYQAQSSLGGSLLQTSLKDLAAPVSTFTEQFMDDLAINSIDDLAAFMLSTEFSFNEDSGDGNNNSTSVSLLLRMRGLSVSRTINYFPASHNMDRFSTDRAEQIRGPNAVLFGFGNPGGIINVTTKRAMLNRTQGQVIVQGKSYDGMRYEIDLNQLLVKNKLAFRVAAMKSQQGSWRNWQSDDQERYFGTLKWRIGTKTEINVEGEAGIIDQMTNRATIGTDAITTWLAAGSQLSATASTEYYVRNLGNTNRLVLDTNSGTLMNWRGKTASALVTAGTGENMPITDYDLVPRETALYGPGFGTQNKYSRIGANFTHSFTKDWHFEISAIRTIVHNEVDDPQAAAGRFLTADTNEFLPDGTPNPNAGRPYLESTGQYNRVRNVDEGIRAMMKYTKDFKKWGRHTLAGSFLYFRGSLEQEMLRETIVSPSDPGVSQLWRRTYVGRQLADGSWTLKGVPSKSIVMADWRLHPINGLIDMTNTTESWSTGGRAYEVAMLPWNNNTQMNSYSATSVAAVLQSFFFKNRLVTTLGASYDVRADSESAMDEAIKNDMFPDDTRIWLPYYVFGNPDSEILRPDSNLSISARSFSGSVVYHLARWVSLAYSKAENKGLPVFSGHVWSANGYISVIRPPTSQGKSDDASIKLDLFNKKLFATLTWYKTAERQAYQGSNILKAEINRIWNFMNNSVNQTDYGFPATPPGFASYESVTDNSTGYTCDRETNGIELELTANPTENLRIRISYNQGITKDRNIAPEKVAHVEKWRDFWGDYADVVLGNGNTIGRTVEIIDDSILNDITLANGRRPRGQVPYQLRANVSYDFSQAILKGFSIGFGVSYNGRPVIGYFSKLDLATNKRIDDDRRGLAQCLVDFRAAYNRKITLLGKSYMWRLQLNVSNLLNDSTDYPIREMEGGEITMYRFSNPMAVTVTSRIRF